MKRLLTRKEASALLKCSVKTMVRIERQFGLRPVTYTGLEPVFEEQAVRKADFARMVHKRKTIAKLAARKGANG